MVGGFGGCMLLVTSVVALDGTNTVDSGDIVNQTIQAIDITAVAVGISKILDGTIVRP